MNDKFIYKLKLNFGKKKYVSDIVSTEIYLITSKCIIAPIHEAFRSHVYLI